MTTEKQEARRLEYMPLDKLESAKRNPKLHAKEAIGTSIGRFGFTEPMLLDERTQRLVAGHGRLESLRGKKAAGEAPPAGIKADKDGHWLVPVLRGWRSHSDTEAEAYLLASNQLTMAAGWDETTLPTMLRELLEQNDGALDGLGFEDAYLQKLLDDATPEPPKGVDFDPQLKFQITIECKDEPEQARIMEKLLAEGISCKAQML